MLTDPTWAAGFRGCKIWVLNVVSWKQNNSYRSNQIFLSCLWGPRDHQFADNAMKSGEVNLGLLPATILTQENHSKFVNTASFFWTVVEDISLFAFSFWYRDATLYLFLCSRWPLVLFKNGLHASVTMKSELILLPHPSLPRPVTPRGAPGRPWTWASAHGHALITPFGECSVGID
jgi:hypothetical protein